MYVVLVPVAVILIFITVTSIIQRKFPQILPDKLKNWKFLPTPLRSLKPYDRIIERLNCVKLCRKHEVTQDDKKNGRFNQAYECETVWPCFLLLVIKYLNFLDCREIKSNVRQSSKYLLQNSKDYFNNYNILYFPQRFIQFRRHHCRSPGRSPRFLNGTSLSWASEIEHQVWWIGVNPKGSLHQF